MHRIKYINNTPEAITLQLSRDEFGILRGCAIHVLQDFAMGKNYNVEVATGWKKEKAQQFADALKTAYSSVQGTTITYSFNKKEIIYLIHIINDAVKFISWEFQSLIGRTLQEASQLAAKLQRLM